MTPIKPLRTQADYEQAMAEIDALMRADASGADADRLGVLCILAADFERGAGEIGGADPVEVLKLSMQAQGRSQADLAAVLGSRARASEVLSGRRGVSSEMAARLSRAWAIPARLLAQGAQTARRNRRTAIKAGVAGAALLLTAGVAGVTVANTNLPSVTALTNYAPGQNRALAADFAPLATIPAPVVQAFLAAEDARYFAHGPVSAKAIARASANAPGMLISGDKPQGAATITQQVVKNVLLAGEKRSVVRKLREMSLAARVEAEVPKDRILEIYLNEIYFGGGTYGLPAAARRYFGKSVSELTVADAAYLAGLPAAPDALRFDKPGNLQAAQARRDWVLSRMREEGFITDAAAQQAQATPLSPT
jgi:penicillin-binding protein 1A